VLEVARLASNRLGLESPQQRHKRRAIALGRAGLFRRGEHGIDDLTQQPPAAGSSRLVPPAAGGDGPGAESDDQGFGEFGPGAPGREAGAFRRGHVALRAGEIDAG